MLQDGVMLYTLAPVFPFVLQGRLGKSFSMHWFGNRDAQGESNVPLSASSRAQYPFYFFNRSTNCFALLCSAMLPSPRRGLRAVRFKVWALRLITIVALKWSMHAFLPVDTSGFRRVREPKRILSLLCDFSKRQQYRTIMATSLPVRDRVPSMSRGGSALSSLLQSHRALCSSDDANKARSASLNALYVAERPKACDIPCAAA